MAKSSQHKYFKKQIYVHFRVYYQQKKMFKLIETYNNNINLTFQTY